MDGKSGECLDHLENITKGLRSFEVLARLGPGDPRSWEEVTDIWRDVFTAAAVILGTVYLAIGLIAATLLIKKGSPRLKIRTFFAIYLNVSIMGFSRAVLYWLDPFGMIGFVGGKVVGWIVVSRYIAVLGFPSFIASSTMIVFTLLTIMDVKKGKKWYGYWRYVIIISLVPYAIAICAESLAYINTYTALVIGLVCETFFVVWGLTVCVAYLTAGLRLLKKLQARNREMTEVLETSNSHHNIGSNQSNELTKKQSKVYRKIFKITFGTTITGILYTLVAAVGTILAFLFVFHQCMGFMERRASPAVWLFLHIAMRALEIVFSLTILYSVTDMTVFYACWTCKKNSQLEVEKPQRRGTEKFSMQNSDYFSQHQVEAEDVAMSKPNDTNQHKEYKLHVKEPSKTSVQEAAFPRHESEGSHMSNDDTQAENHQKSGPTAEKTEEPKHEVVQSDVVINIK